MTRQSFYKFQACIIIFACVITGIIHVKDLEQIVFDNYSGLINGMGVMTAFFILAIDKVNIEKLKKTYVGYAEVPTFKRGKKVQILFAEKIINTVITLLNNTFVVLGLSYTALIFFPQTIFATFIIVLLNFNIICGFLFIVSIWHSVDIQ